MSEDHVYKDGDIVWVKLGNNWWPGEVTDVHRQPQGLLKSMKKKPYCVVKFFQEDAYEYIKNSKHIYPFQCSKKEEFVKKGTALYNAKNKFMEKFPSDVEIAERLTRKTVEAPLLIINDRPDSIVKAILGPTYTRRSNDYYDNGYNSTCNSDYNNKRRSGDSVTKILNITPQRTTLESSLIPTPDTTKIITKAPLLKTTNSNVTSSDTNFYKCSLCNFSSQRQNVMILHRRTHSMPGGGATSSTTASAAISTLQKTATATITTTKVAKTSTNPIVEAITPAKRAENRSYDEDDDKEREVPQLGNNATHNHGRSNRNKNGHKRKSFSRAEAASTNALHHKLRSSLRLDADVGEMTLLDNMPAAATKHQPKSGVNNDTNNQSAPPLFEDVIQSALRVGSPPQHNVESAEADNGPVEKSATRSAAEKIRQQLLADWSDGEKEEEDMPHEFVAGNETSTDLCVKRGQVAYRNAIPSLTNTEPQTSKQNRIRNIPKKDRRDAVLKEFTSDYNAQSGVTVDSMPSANYYSSSSSTNSVVLFSGVPPHGSETIVIDDQLDDAVVEATHAVEVDINGGENEPSHETTGDVDSKEHLELHDHKPELDIEAELERALQVDLESVKTKVEPEIFEYTRKLRGNRGTTNQGSERAANQPKFRLIDEMANNDIQIEACVDKKIQIVSSDGAEIKQEGRKEQTKTKSGDKGQRSSKRLSGAAREILNTSSEITQTTKVEYLTGIELEGEQQIIPQSPSVPLQVKEEELPQTSAAAADLRTDCFDFQEDDLCSDALRSIADFKKKYFSPDKAQDKSDKIQVDNGMPQAVIECRRSIEQKDQQLARDIEMLLEQTADTIPAVGSRTHSYGSSKEELPVKGLPIKERGKRIFKSRNRSRIEETATTALAANVKQSGVSVAVEVMSEENRPRTQDQTVEGIELNRNVESLGGVERRAFNLKEPVLQVPKALKEIELPLGGEVATLNANSCNNRLLEDYPAERLATEAHNIPTESIETNDNNLLGLVEVQAGDTDDYDKSAGVEGVHQDEKRNDHISPKQSDESIGEENDGTAVHNHFDDELKRQEDLREKAGLDTPPESTQEGVEESTIVQTDETNDADNEQKAPEVQGEGPVNEMLENFKENINVETEADKIHATPISNEKDTEEACMGDPHLNSAAEKLHEPNDESLAADSNLKNNALEADGDEAPPSRIVSPIDDNSSVGISEAGAEFGSPTSMLDDERLPAITGNLITPVESQVTKETIPKEAEEVFEERQKDVNETVEENQTDVEDNGVNVNVLVSERPIEGAEDNEENFIQDRQKEIVGGENEETKLSDQPIVDVNDEEAIIEQHPVDNENMPDDDGMQNCAQKPESIKNQLREELYKSEAFCLDVHYENENIVNKKSEIEIRETEAKTCEEDVIHAAPDDVGEKSLLCGTDLMDNSITADEQVCNAETEKPSLDEFDNHAETLCKDSNILSQADTEGEEGEIQYQSQFHDEGKEVQNNIETHSEESEPRNETDNLGEENGIPTQPENLNEGSDIINQEGIHNASASEEQIGLKLEQYVNHGIDIETRYIQNAFFEEQILSTQQEQNTLEEQPQLENIEQDKIAETANIDEPNDEVVVNTLFEEQILSTQQEQNTLEEQPQLENIEQDKIAETANIDEPNDKVAVTAEPENSDIDDDYIESPPLEPLSGHEDDTEMLKSKRTQKRRTFAERQDSANATKDLETEIEKDIQDVQRNQSSTSSTSESPKYYVESEIKASSRRHSLSKRKSRKSKDCKQDFLRENTKEENDEKLNKKKPRKSIKSLKSREKRDEVEGVIENAGAEGLAISIQNADLTREQELMDAGLQQEIEYKENTETLADAPQPSEQHTYDTSDVNDEPLATTSATIFKTASSRKRCNATKTTSHRNASDAMENSEYAEQDVEPVQKAKIRKIEKTNYAREELMSNPSPEADGAHMAHEQNNGSSLLGTVEQSQLVIEGNELQSITTETDSPDASKQQQLQLSMNNEVTDQIILGNEQEYIVESAFVNNQMSVQQVLMETSTGNDNNGATAIETETAITTVENVIEEETVHTESHAFNPNDINNPEELVAYSPLEQEQQQEMEESTVKHTDQTMEYASISNIDETLAQQFDSESPANPANNATNNVSPIEKVRINVDVANPLSTQIASILGTKSAADVTKKRKTNLEEAVATYNIERPEQSPQQQQQIRSGLDFTIGQHDAIAHVQQMCPQVKITRKEKIIEMPPDVAAEEHTETMANHNTNTMFDISNMPIVLGNEHFMSAQGDMQIVLTSSAEAQTPQLRTADGQQILQPQPQIFRTVNSYASTQQNVQQQLQQQLHQAGLNKPGLIIIKAAPGDFIIQQGQQQSQAIVCSGAVQQLATSLAEAKTTTTTYNLGSGVTLLPIAEPKQKQPQRQQQPQELLPSNKKPKTAATTSGARKQVGNAITLPSSITVKQRQKKVTDSNVASTANAAAATKQHVKPAAVAAAAAAVAAAAATAVEQKPCSSKSTGVSHKVQKRIQPAIVPRRTHTQPLLLPKPQTIQQRRLTATFTNLFELQQQEQRRREMTGQLIRRLSYSEVLHASQPTKIFRNIIPGGVAFDGRSEQAFAMTAEQQLLQLQQQHQQQQQQQLLYQQVPSPAPRPATPAQPPPLQPMRRKSRLSSQQHLRRLSAKPEAPTPCVAQNEVELQKQQQQEQQQQQVLQPTQFVLLDQQPHLSLEQQHHQQEQQGIDVNVTSDLEASASSAEIIPAQFEALPIQEPAPQVYTEEILAEAFEANELPPSSVMAVPSQPMPGYPDTLLLCRRVDDEWLPVVAQPYYFTQSDQQLRPIPKEVLIGHPILTPIVGKTTEMTTTNESYKGETGVTILIGNEYVHMEWDQFLEVMRSNDDLFDLRDEHGRIFQLTREALLTLQNDADLQEKYRQLQQLLEEQQLEEQQQLEQQQILQQHLMQQLQTVTVAGGEGLETDIIPLLQIDTSQTLQLIGTDDGNLILQPTLAQPPLSPPCTRTALTNATNALLNQTPIMSPLEKPSTAQPTATLITDSTGQHINLATAATTEHLAAAGFITSDDANALTVGRPTLGDSLAVIGVVPTQATLLPTTVTNPAIAPPKTDLIPDMTTAAQMHAQYRHAQRAIYNDPNS